MVNGRLGFLAQQKVGQTGVNVPDNIKLKAIFSVRKNRLKILLMVIFSICL